MILIDVNVLVYAHRKDAPDHERYRSWLLEQMSADAAYAVSDIILSSVLRIVTHPRIFQDPSPWEIASAFVHDIRDRPTCVLVAPGERHWDIFLRLCRESGAKGNLIPDAYLAAMAIESGTEWITTDRDFSRFHGLQYRHPLEPPSSNKEGK